MGFDFESLSVLIFNVFGLPKSWKTKEIDRRVAQNQGCPFHSRKAFSSPNRSFWCPFWDQKRSHEVSKTHSKTRCENLQKVCPKRHQNDSKMAPQIHPGGSKMVPKCLTAIGGTHFGHPWGSKVTPLPPNVPHRVPKRTPQAPPRPQNRPP